MDDDKKMVAPEDNDVKTVESELEVQENKIKIISPGTMVMKRFFRSKLSVVGLCTLIFLFLFSFLGPLFSVWGETGTDEMPGDAMILDNDFPYPEMIVGEQSLNDIINDYNKTVPKEGDKPYDNADIQVYLKDIFNDLGGGIKDGEPISGANGYPTKCATYNYSGTPISYIVAYEGAVGYIVYTVDIKKDDKGETVKDSSGNEVYSLRSTRIVVRSENPRSSNLNASPFTRGFVYKKDKKGNYVMQDKKDANGNYVMQDVLDRDGNPVLDSDGSIKQERVQERVQEKGFHLLGTDEHGRDILTRLMHGGRISLTLGFAVVFIQMILGMLFGGLAGYFGKWVDNLIMRITDILICLPGMPILLIVSTILDGMEGIPDAAKIYYVLSVLALIGWPGTARFVRGQILMLREQEYMVAAEALGLSVPRRIVKHLLPNVMPLLIVSATAGLGGVILTEASLSYLGLGIKAPRAAWGTMINTSNNPIILQYFPNQWIPAGVMIVLAVLAFNFLGDGLRDAFDPKMKR